MDVNAIGSNMNSIKVYSNSKDMSQYSTDNFNETINKNSGISDIKQAEKGKENQNNEESKDGIDKKELDKAVKKLNKFLEDEKTHAEYSVHKDLGTLMIKIVNDEEKVLLEVPPEKILNMVASMCKQVGLLDKKA